MKPVPMPPAMRSEAALRLFMAQAAQREFATYVKGCLDGLGLKGNYTLNTTTWTFEPAPDPSEKKDPKPGRGED